MSERGAALGCGGYGGFVLFGICVWGIVIGYHSSLIFCVMGWFGECTSTTPLGTTVVLQSKQMILFALVFFSIGFDRKEMPFHVITMLGLRIADLVEHL